MPASLRLRLTASAAALTAILGVAQPLTAEEAWNPFKPRELTAREKRLAPAEAPRSPTLPPMGGLGTSPWRSAPGGGPAEAATEPQLGGEPAPANPRGEPAAIDRQALPPLDERSRAVERGDLQPVMANDGSGLPAEFWQGVEAKAVERVLAQLDIPPRSPALAKLWRRIWTTNATPPAGDHFEALRLEALARSGLHQQARERAGSTEPGASPLLTAVRARTAIGLGARVDGCRAARRVAGTGDGVEPGVKAEMLLMSAYCAAADDNPAAAGLALELARAEGAKNAFALAALDAFVAGAPFKPQPPKRLTLQDYRFLIAAKAAPSAELLAASEPGLLAALALDAAGEPGLRIVAAEAAARANAIDAEALADVYRSAAVGLPDQGDLLAARGDPNYRRAQLFRAIDGERTPMRKARLARALLDEARRARLGLPLAAIMSRPIGTLVPAQEIGWFAESAIEIHLVAGEIGAARRWLEFSTRDRGDGLQHWALLIDLAEVQAAGPRGSAFPSVEQLAQRGRLTSDLLHRLATVLDALDYQIPIPLWEAASRTPQPSAGHLPETGVLSQLKDAAGRKELARTVLLAIQSLGPASGETAHIIALGDVIRALRRAGMEQDARNLAVEAVIGGWPRMASN